MKPISLLIPVFLVFFSCHGRAGTSYRCLTKASLYYIDTVRMALTGGGEKAAAKTLQVANDHYKKGGDTTLIIDLYKGLDPPPPYPQSIL